VEGLRSQTGLFWSSVGTLQSFEWKIEWQQEVGHGGSTVTVAERPKKRWPGGTYR
jgi:hypothetical protein